MGLIDLCRYKLTHFSRLNVLTFMTTVNAKQFNLVNFPLAYIEISLHWIRFVCRSAVLTEHSLWKCLYCIHTSTNQYENKNEKNIQHKKECLCGPINVYVELRL